MPGSGAGPIKGGAVLYSEMTPPETGEDAFNDWYDNHHAPSHVNGVPGFLSAQRYKSPAGAHYLAIYDLDSAAALDSAEYRERKHTPDAATREMLESMSGFTRYIGNEISFQVRDGTTPEQALDAEMVIAVFFAAPPENWSELVNWYESEHTPLLLECEDWLMTRHMEIVDFNPEPFSHMMLHYVRDVSVMKSPELERARATDEYKRLRATDWYDPLFVSYRRRRTRFLPAG
jgi:hypothetical protein